MFNKLTRFRSRSNAYPPAEGSKGGGRVEPSLLASPSLKIVSGSSPPSSGGSRRSVFSTGTSGNCENEAGLASEAEGHRGTTDSIIQRAAAKISPEKKTGSLSRRESLRPEEGSKQSLGCHLESHVASVTSFLLEADIDRGPDVFRSFEDAEEAFLEEFEDYFANLSVDSVRKEQYPQLDLQKIVYLDYANFSLFSRFQVEEHCNVLQQEAPSLRAASLANSSSSHLMKHITETNQRLLKLFNTTEDEYAFVFTTGFNAAVRVFADGYSFQRGSFCLVCQDNHEAVKIIINAANQQGVRSLLNPVGEVNLGMHSTMLRKTLRSQGSRGGLFVFPAQSCLSGVRHSLNWIPEAQQSGWNTLVDVSTYLPSGSLDLSVVQPEFVVGSFRHLLGYPSGMGFLLVRKASFRICNGSGVSGLKFTPSSSGQECGKDYHLVCEDESINLLSFAALNFGLQHLESIGLEPIRKRVQCLTAWLVTAVKALQHKGDEGKSLVQLYGPTAVTDRGSIVAFNLLDSTGHILSSSLVQRLAEKNNIVIGSGYFQNPGLANALSMKASDRVKDVSLFDKAPSFSSIRVSFGPVSAFTDVYRLVQFLSKFRDEDYVASEAVEFLQQTQSQSSEPLPVA